MSSNFPNDFSITSDSSPVGAQSKPPVVRKDVRVLFSWLVFIVTLILVAVAYGANIYLSGFDRFGIKVNGKIQDIGGQIEELEDHIQISTIEELILFEKRIATLKDLAVSRSGYLPLFETLSGVILDSVTFESASIDLTGDSYSVSVSAVADSLYAYLQQLEVIRNSNNPIVQKMQVGSYSIQRDDTGRGTVSFSFTMAVPFSDLQGPAESEPVFEEEEDYNPFVEGDVEIPEDDFFNNELP